jgi:hypothetical protein
MAINPNLLPRIGFSANNSTHKPVTWMEITQPDGSVSHESLSQDDLAQRLLTLLTDSGGLAPQWLVDTHADLQCNNVQWIVCCYTFDSCLRTSPMSQRPKSLASANDADWSKVA